MVRERRSGGGRRVPASALWWRHLEERRGVQQVRVLTLNESVRKERCR